ncbi:MAG: HipA domain-containing protein [Clostridiales bacterium]|nr:HipA domain-containing protein [Clostridiales bacterium]
MQNKIDFIKCKVVPTKAFGGANGKKISIEYNGELYMLKFPSSAENKPTDLSYTNSCISEHIASSIFNILGLNAQKTILGTYTVNGKEKVVCACKDFTADGEQFYDFSAIKNTIIDSEHQGAGTELEEILETIEKQKFVNPVKLTEFFWDMFAVDALLGNFDRHNGNWGFLVDNNGNSKIAPVFDCGSCLLPQADDKIMEKILNNSDELNARIYQFPTSAIKEGNRKINYFDFLTNCNNNNCNEAVKRITKRIDLAKINAFIDDVPYISELQREFYKQYITARYEKILEFAYDNIIE